MSNIRSMAEALRHRLNQRKQGWRELCANNPGLSYSWLSKFAAGMKENPRLESMERLEQALNKQDMIEGVNRENV